MRLELLHKKLIAAARADQPREDAPYAFEKRVMARVRQAPALPDAAVAFSIALWRAAAPCLVIMTAMAAWVYFEENTVQAGFEPDLEQTMLAAVENTGDTW